MEKLTDGELRLMEVLWDLAPINSTQLVAACKERLSWSKSTTYTVLRRLVHKGAAENPRGHCDPSVHPGGGAAGPGQRAAHPGGGDA